MTVFYAMSVFRGLFALGSRDVQNIRRYLMHRMNDGLTPENNSSIISLANSTAIEIHIVCPRNSWRNQFVSPWIRYIMDKREEEKKHRRGCVWLRPWRRTALTRGDVPWVEPFYIILTDLCIRPDSCVRHSLRVESTDARHPVFFSISYRLLRMRCVSDSAILLSHTWKHKISSQGIAIRHIHFYPRRGSVELIWAINKISAINQRFPFIGLWIKTHERFRISCISSTKSLFQQFKVDLSLINIDIRGILHFFYKLYAIENRGVVTNRDKRLGYNSSANNDSFRGHSGGHKVHIGSREWTQRGSPSLEFSSEPKRIKVSQRAINQAAMDAFHFGTNK